jgi:hypothetical protein
MSRKLTEHELLFFEVTHKRLLELIDDPEVTVTDCEVSFNDYGDWLFIVLIWNEPDLPYNKDQAYTFFGLGEHYNTGRRHLPETHGWQFYDAHFGGNEKNPALDKVGIFQTIVNRVQEVRSWGPPRPRTAREKTYEFLLDNLGDEDGIISEMEDMEQLYGGDYFDGLFEDDEELGQDEW